MGNANGIAAKFGGKCEFDCLYGGTYEKDHLIDRVSRDSKKWGHTQCVREWVAKHGNIEPGGARPAPAVSTPAPSTNGHGHASTTGRNDFPNTPDDLAEAYWSVRDAMTAISQATLKTALAFEKLARARDPHGVRHLEKV